MDLLAPTTFLNRFAAWAGAQLDIQAVALVGSYARGTARTESDVDIVLITDKPERYLRHDEWLARFGPVVRVEEEDWGRVQSRRVFYSSGLEVEYGITTAQWAELDPVDPGTRQVAEGMRVLFDRGILDSLSRALASG